MSTTLTSTPSSEPPTAANPPLNRPHFPESYIHLTDEDWLALRRECQLGEQLIRSLTGIGQILGLGRGPECRVDGGKSLKTLMVGLDRIVERRFSRKPCTWRNDGELPMVEIIDLLTGERTEACDHSFAGGFHAALWCVHRLMRAESGVQR